MKTNRISRRDFLKGLGAAGVLSLGAIGVLETPKLPRNGTDDEQPWEEMPQLIPTVCGMCDAHCGVLAYVVGERLYKLEGNYRHSHSLGRICSRGSAGIKLLYDPDRVKYPLKRVGEGRFERITWEQAFQEIAERLKAIRDGSGPQSLAWAYHPDLADLWDEQFMKAFGSPNIFTHTSLGRSSAMQAAHFTLGWEPVPDLGHARYIVLFGRNYAESIFYAAATQAIMEAKERGATIIVIDPRLSHMAAQAHEWIPIRPGTDGAMLLAMMNVLVTEKGYDTDFVARYTVGFAELRDYLSDKTPAWAASICDVPAATIQRIAREFAAAKPACLVDPGHRGAWGAAYENSFQTARAALALNALVGNYGAKGGLLQPPPSPLGRFQPPLTPEIRASRADGAGGASFPLASVSDGILHLLPEIILTERPYPVRALFVKHLNLVRSLPNTAKVVKALHKLDLLVAIDTQISDTAALAHYILPESTYLERLEPPSPSAYLITEAALRQPVVKPLYDTKAAYDIIASLAEALGIGKYLDFNVETVIEKQLEPLKMKLAEFSRAGVWKGDAAPIHSIPSFATPSGKIELYSQRLRDAGFRPLPEFEPPRSRPIGVDSFRLIQGRDAAHTGTATQTNAYLHALRSENRVWISAARAARLSIKEGDWITVESEAGQLRARAHTTEGIHPEAVFLVHGSGHHHSDRMYEAYSKRGRPEKTVCSGGINDGAIIVERVEPAGGGAAMGETLVRVRRYQP